MRRDDAVLQHRRLRLPPKVAVHQEWNGEVPDLERRAREILDVDSPLDRGIVDNESDVELEASVRRRVSDVVAGTIGALVDAPLRQVRRVDAVPLATTSAVFDDDIAESTAAQDVLRVERVADSLEADDRSAVELQCEL